MRLKVHTKSQKKEKEERNKVRPNKLWISSLDTAQRSTSKNCPRKKTTRYTRIAIASVNKFKSSELLVKRWVSALTSPIILDYHL